jgi:hypothetical protein
MKKLTLLGSITLALSAAVSPSVSAAPVKPIQFAKGAIGTTVAGSFKGYDDIQYSLNAKAGQTLSYKLTSNHDLAQINIYAPGDKPGKSRRFGDWIYNRSIWKIQAARIRQLFDSDLPNAEYGTE